MSLYSFVLTEMNPSLKEIRRRQMPDAFKKEVDWFAKGFHQPKTRLEISASTIDAFQTMIWDKPGDDLLPTYGKYICFFHLRRLLAAHKTIFIKSPPVEQRSRIKPSITSIVWSKITDLN